MISWLSIAAASEVAAVVVGSGAYWQPGCVGEARDCTDASRTLGFADDDAWKAAFLLRPTVEDRLRVLVRKDASTADLRIDGAPRRDQVTRAVQELASRASTTDIVIYIAAHGSPGELHLEDGRHRFADVRSDWLEAAGDKRLILIADACHSASWRGGPLARSVRPGRYPPVLPSPHRMFESVVVGGTPEDTSLAGGVFTYLVFSGWMGGADRNRDGSIDAPEMSDFVHAYASVADPSFNPRIRSPRSTPLKALPVLLGTPVTLEADTPTRWVVEHDSGRWLVDAVSVDGEPVEIVLPDGDFRLWTVGLRREERGWTSQDAVSVAPVTIEEGVAAIGEPAATVDTADTGAVTLRGLPSGPSVSAVGALQRRPRLGVDWVSLGAGLGLGWLPPDRAATEVVLGYAHTGPRRLAGWASASFTAAVLEEPEFFAGRGLAGMDVRWLQSGRLGLSARAGFGVEGFHLPGLSMTGWGPTGEAHLRLDVRDQSWGVWLEAGASTAVHQTVAGEWLFDGLRSSGRLGLQWRL